MRALRLGLLELLLPAACARCGAAGAAGALCGPCDAGLPRLPRGRCPLCQEAPAAPRGGACAACRAAGPALSACTAAVPFAGAAAELLRRFKYPRPGLAGLDPAADAAAVALAREAARRAPGPAPSAVVPVPLHPLRLRARGFQPSTALARAVARERAAPLRTDALLRVRDTASQTGLDRDARRSNVAGAFRAAAPAPARVWLVDDVVTTGATLEAAAHALRRAGAEELAAVCAARTPGAG